MTIATTAIATTTAPRPQHPPVAAPDAEPTARPAGRVRLRTALRRHAYAALALPVGLLALVTAPLGAARPMERWQRTLATRLLAVHTARPPLTAPGATRRVVGHAIVSLPVNLVAFALVVPLWAVVLTRGVAYPLFGADNLDQSWGGPTLAGAWFVHFIQGPPLLALVTLVLAPISRLQAHLAEHHFTPSRRG